MALNRASTNRFSATIWPGFVDAMTALLMVLMFVLTIFVIVQSVLREQVTNQGSTITRQEEQLSRQEQRLNQLGQQVSALGQALSVSEERGTGLEEQLAEQDDVQASLEDQLAQSQAQARDRAARITRLGNQLESSRTELQDAKSRLTDFEAEVATLIAARHKDFTESAAAQKALQDRLDQEQERASVAELAVAAARTETDASAEAARLAAARREALEALVADLRSRNAETGAQTAQLRQDLTATETRLSKAEAARLAEAEAAKALRQRLEESDAELTAMTLSLEESRKEAEETLTLLAAAEAARDRLSGNAGEAATASDRQAALLETARAELARQKDISTEDQRRLALLNEQVASLTAELSSLQSLLDTAGGEQDEAELRVKDLGQQLNAALLRATEEKERRLQLEEEARRQAEEEVRDLARYRSEFFGRMSQILSGREGVKIVGDRFVFQSEVLFPPGEASLSDSGHEQVAGVARMLAGIADEIPDEIDWIIRVDGHTDNTPLSGTGRYRDNWELSQARALAVVRYMIEELDFPKDRLAAAGFADTKPVDEGDTTESRARNRRIELKLTER